MKAWRKHVGAIAALGGGLTVAVTIADLLGAFSTLEGRSIDIRFQYSPRPPEPLHDDIAFVDIDDGAVDPYSIGGRWPWSREKIGLALGEIARAGAKTIVIDVLLSEPQTGDDVVAAAVGTVPTALAIDLSDPSSRSDVKPTDELRIGAQLRQDARRDLDAIAARHGGDLDLEQLLAETTLKPKGTEANLGLRSLLEGVYYQDRAWRVITPKLLSAKGNEPALARSPMADPELALAPVLAFAQAAGAAGFVNFKADADTAVRTLEVVRGVRDAGALQLGIAAALLHRGVPLSEVHVQEHELVAGGTRLPLDDRQRLWIVWPTPRTGNASDPQAWVHCTGVRYSMGRALEIALNLRKLEEPRKARDELARKLAQDFKISGTGEKLLADVREQGVFLVGKPGEEPPADSLSPEDLAIAEAFKEFRKIDEPLAQADAILTPALDQMRAALNGKLVFVGWTATGAASDFVPTPMGARTPGVVAHAAAADMVLSGRSLTFAPRALGPVLALALGLIAAATSLLPLTASFLISAAAVAAQLAYVFIAFGSHHYVVPLVAPQLSGLVVWVGATALQSALARRDQRLITRQFKTRVASELVDYLVEHPDALSMGGEPREVTAFFSDLAGFTSLSEKLGAHETVALLNKCMIVTTEALTKHGAYVNKYLGDGVMAFWSAFRPDPDQATHACEAALAAQAALASVIDVNQVSARMGIATGRVIVGDCGAPPLLHDYTAIGDAINLSSRLESANKQFGTKILIDGKTRTQVRDAASTTRLRFRYCGRVVVVGQTTPIDLHEVVPESMAQEQIEMTELAVDAYRRGKLGESAGLFQKLESGFGKSKLVSVYLDAIAHPEPEAQFDGILRLKAK